MNTRKMIWLPALIALSLVLSACGASAKEPTPTPIDPNLIAAQAIATFSAQLTQTAFAIPTATATLTPAPTNTVPAPTFAPISTVAGGGAVAQPTSSCNTSVWISDVSIPDGTVMQPGDTFTKTWRVQNSGTCTWTPEFKVSFGGVGLPMGGQATKLGKTVKPGEQIEISVNLVAPSTAGDQTSYWKLQDDKGAFFGTWLTVVIKVAGAAAKTATPTETPTATP